MKRLLVFIAVLLASVSIAYATELSISTVNDQISPYDSAKFMLKVSNNLTKSDTFFISANDMWWAVSTEPLKDYTMGIDVPARGTASTTLLLKPREYIGFGVQNIEIVLTSKITNEIISDVVSVNVREDLINYPTNIEVEIVMPDKLDPRKISPIKVQITNNNRKNIEDLTVRLKSAFFEKTAVVELEPEHSKSIDFSVNINKSVEPQKDTLEVELIHNGQTIKKVSKEYEISSYGIFKTTSSTEKKFLGSLIAYTFVNDGNSKYTDNVLLETGFLKRLFTSTNPDTESTSIDGKYYLTREVTLGPNESLVINVRIDYKPILYLIILIIALIVFYFVFRSPLIVAKEASDITIDEGGINSLRAIIKLKNRSNSIVRNIRVVDKMPRIAVFERRESDTLQPSKLYPYSDGTVINWAIPKLDPGEVRIITYRLKTKLGVVGELRLKPVIVQYGNRKVYSNAVDAVSP
jgi:hypothetical protein